MSNDTFAMISIDDLNLVNGGWAREGLGHAGKVTGEAIGGAIDGVGNAAYNTGVAAKDLAVATGRGLYNAGVYVADSARQGTANTLNFVGNGLNAAADFVRPPCR